MAYSNKTARNPKGTLKQASKTMKRGKSGGKVHNSTKPAPGLCQNQKKRGHY